MRGLAVWQIVVIVLVAVVFVGGMSVVVWRLAMRTSSGTAVARPGTKAESGWYGAVAPTDAAVYDGFSYRVSARFAGRSRVVVDGDDVIFCGPRGPKGLYWLWIWLQALCMAAAPVAIVWGVAAFDWRPLVWGLGLVVVSTLVMAIGAGVWPGLGEVPGLTEGHYPALEMSKADIRDVKIGPGWADGGLAIVLTPYVKPIDALAEGHGVSWWGPDETGREVRYALHCYDSEQARDLYEQLSGGR